jgi:hypothetical protein
MAFVMFAAAPLGIFFHMKEKFKALLLTMAGMMLVLVNLFLTLIAPPVGVHRSTRELAMELDKMLPRGEKMVFYHTLKDSALFYTDRKAVVIKSGDAFVEYMLSNTPVLCIIEKRHLEDFEELEGKVNVLSHRGKNLLITNKPGS